MVLIVDVLLEYKWETTFIPPFNRKILPSYYAGFTKNAATPAVANTNSGFVWPLKGRGCLKTSRKAQFNYYFKAQVCVNCHPPALL